MIAASDTIVEVREVTILPPVYDHPQLSLEKAPFICYLTGSRYFGDFTSASDYDYLTIDSVSVRSYLLQQGFERLASPSYGLERDVTLVEVYRRGNVDVQLLTHEEHLAMKLMAMRLFKSAGMWPSKKKHGLSKRCMIWTTMLSLTQRMVEWSK